MENNPKIIALYLPQFYEIPENNQWWGQGFTEWTNVKKAVPLFASHQQPSIPLNGNYYNTLDTKTRKWQWEMAKEHGIHGFCYYHYWFKWGKLLLEKPAESILIDGHPNIPFCFSWGNGTWARTWEGQNEDVLMLQEYGDVDDWKAHFNYLLPFFQSSLYIRKDDKPLFLIHYTKHMGWELLESMILKWQEWALESGLSGIYFVETITSAQNEPYAKSSSAVMLFEPLSTIRNSFSLSLLPNIAMHSINRIIKRLFRKGLFINKISYENVWDLIIKNNISYEGKKVFLWWFVWWDNSPRKWKDSLIMTGSNPEIFKKYLSKQFIHAKEIWSDYIFLNAWNEWGEWAYLEPDEKNKYWYLEAIKNTVNKHN